MLYLHVLFKSVYENVNFLMLKICLLDLWLMQEERVLKGQELENAVLDADYVKAIQVAIDLRHPHRLFDLFSKLLRFTIILFNHSDAVLSLPLFFLCKYLPIYSFVLSRKRVAEDQIERALCAFDKDKFRLLLEYVREWNSKPKLCHVAQFVLFRVFNILSPIELVEVLLLHFLSKVN